MTGLHRCYRKWGIARFKSPCLWVRIWLVSALLAALLVGSSAATGFDAQYRVQTLRAAQQADTVFVEPVGDQMEFGVKKIEAKSGSRITIVMNNTASNPAMHHNVAVLRLNVDDEEGIVEVGVAAMNAGEEQGYVPDHDAVVAATPMAAPGQRTEITFTVPPPGSYPFVCLYPGHYVVMRGVFVSTR